MKQMISVCLVVFIGLAPSYAGQKEDAIVAIMRLSEQPNYSWVATVTDDARSYDISGQTKKGGFTRVTMPMINSVRRRLGRSSTDTTNEIVFRGNVACVIATESGWLRPEELPLPGEAEVDPVITPGRPGPLGTGILGNSGVRRRTSGGRDQEERRPYSNLQLALSHPHEELGVIVCSHQELRVDGDIVTGTLTELGAQLLLVRDGQDQITPLRAAGTFKLWLRGGLVARYLVRLEGTLSIDTSRGNREVSVHQVTDTVIKDVGKTRFDIPDEARQKLGG